MGTYDATVAAREPCDGKRKRQMDDGKNDDLLLMFTQQLQRVLGHADGGAGQGAHAEDGVATDEWDRDFDPTLFVSTHANQQRQRKEGLATTTEEIIVFCVLWLASVFGAAYLGIGRSMPLVFLFLALVGFPIASCLLAYVAVTGRRALARHRAERRTKAMADATDGGSSLPTPADATWLLRRYEKDRNIGDYAKRAIRQLEAVNPIRERLTATVRGRFADGSFSQDRFMGTLDPALRTVEENVAMVASIVAGLDGIGGRIAQVRKNKGRVEAMARILDDNDAIISGMRDLEESLIGLSVTEHHEASREIVATLAEAADDATQYAEV